MRVSTKLFVILGLAVSVGLATAVSPYASAHPDGLEKVAEDKAFLESADGKEHALTKEAPIPDYAFPGIANERVATGVAGFAGVLFVFALGYGLAFVLRRRGSPGAGAGAGAARA